MARAVITLGWLAEAGCPIASLDDETARGFMLASPPRQEGSEWPLGGVYGLSIGQEGAILVRQAMVSSMIPDRFWPHFEIEAMAPIGTPTEAALASVDAVWILTNIVDDRRGPPRAESERPSAHRVVPRASSTGRADCASPLRAGCQP